MTSKHPRAPKARFVTTIVGCLAFAAAAHAQQFQLQSGLIPGPAVWSEGVECADVDHDGDLDVFFANGDGFSSAGTKRQNILLINQFIPTGTLAFTDESTSRLGVHVSNAKGVVTRDVNGDGWVDVLFCNAFDTDTPFLYINQGAANPGFFTLESASRGLTTAISSGNAQFGDIDDDGDPDLLINDGYLGVSRKPRLYLNNGAGFFTEAPALIAAAVAKQSQMDVQLVDVDNDWDLDFVGFCRAANGGTNHYLMLNDGTGLFTNAPVTIPSNSSSTYEGEVGDLDGDNDIDMFLVSSSSFAEGAIRNNLVPNGSLTLTQMAALADSNDDNEIALFDWDVDGDYDALVGSLSNSTETFWRNNGSLSFTNVSSGIMTAQTDSTLDLAVADLNNDGRYDVVTAQGESGAFANKAYKNTGAIDTLAPVVTAIEAPSFVPPAGPFKLHAKVRDQVLDDSVNYVTGSAHYVIRTSIPAPASVAIDPSGLSNSALNVVAGDGIQWTNNLGAAQTIQFTSAPYDYALAPIPSANSLTHVLVHPGVYSYTVQPAGYAGTITVSGSDATVQATYSSGQLYRFLLTDNAAGAGVALYYELVFTDWPGNTRVTPTGTISLSSCNVATYCTAKTNSLGCLPTVSATGSPNLTAGSGFVISATNMLNQKNGLFFYGVSGQAAQPFQGGTMCIGAPRLRTNVTNSGGSPTGFDCTGVLSIDFNTYMAGTPPIPFSIGTVVDGQFWARDPSDTFTTSLSNAIHFTVCN